MRITRGAGLSVLYKTILSVGLKILSSVKYRKRRRKTSHNMERSFIGTAFAGGFRGLSVATEIPVPALIFSLPPLYNSLKTIAKLAAPSIKYSPSASAFYLSNMLHLPLGNMLPLYFIVLISTIRKSIIPL